MYFHKTPLLLKKIYPNLIWSKKIANDKVLFITFDDGPIPEVTDYVLDILNQYNAKATFFCVGENINRYPEVFLKTISNGHSVGNHTQHHLNGWKTEDEAYLKDVALCSASICRHYQSKLRMLFRPPYGRAKMSQIKKLEGDYDIVMWDVLTGDFDSRLSKERCLKKTLTHTENGSIVIFHDSRKAEKNLRFVLPRFLENFSEKGFSFYSL